MNIFRAAFHAGLLTIIISITIMAIFPAKAAKLPEGFITPVIAFEFIQSENEVLDLFGHDDTPERSAIIEKMDRGNMVDFLYMVSYASFLVLFSLSWSRSTGRQVFLAAAVIAVAVLAGDFFENLQLLSITSKIRAGGYERELELLNIFTWIKWGGLALYFVVVTPFMTGKKIYTRTATALAVCTAILAFAAFMHRPVISEIFSLMVAVMFIVSIVFAFSRRKMGSESVAG